MEPMSYQHGSRLKSLADGAIYDRLLTPSELKLVLEKHPPQPDLIAPLIPGRGVFMLHGQPRSRKSLVALELLMALALGVPPLGSSRFSVAGRIPVAYVSAEDDFAVVEKRLRLLARTHGIAEPPEWLYTMKVQKFSLDDEVWVNSFVHDCIRFGVRCIVFDPFRRMTACADSGPAELKPASDALRTIADKTKAVIGLIHHDVRPGTRAVRRREDLPQLASGGGIFGIADAPIHLRKLDPNRVEVTPAEYKLSATPDRFRVRMEFTDDLGREVLRLTDEAIKTRNADGPLGDRIMTLLARGTAPSGSYMARELRAGKGAINRELGRLLAEGRVVRRSYGTSYMWSLPDQPTPVTEPKSEG
jgi:AAA domain